MKKLLALTLAALMVLAFAAGCASESPAPPASGGNDNNASSGGGNDNQAGSGGGGDLTEDKITLKFWESETEGSVFMKYAAEEFTKLYPNIEFEFEPVAHTDATQKIILDGPAGVGPDVFAIPHDMLGANVSGGTVLPSPNAGYVQNNFVSAAVTGATYGGTVYGYPMAIETYALFYNKDILPEPPTTWDEVIDFAATYNDPSDNKYAIVWETSNAYFDYIFFSGHGSFLFGPSGDDRTQHSINAPNTIKAVELFKSLRSILDVPSGDLSGDFCNSAFESGKAAMYIVGPWRIQDCKDSGINFGITTLPIFPGESSPPASFSGVRLMCISAFSNHPAEAAAFLEFCTSNEMALKRFEMISQIPARSDVTVDDEYSAGILAQAAYAFPMPAIPEMGQYWQAMGAAYSNIWDGADVVGELNAATEVMEATIAES
ncbi:MAG: maltose ABC transporter substrate-binding protein [Oscillospiraceae bacterium]|nr:maltose ABC transporter substrate-binding protein [Oscillospiraceae bacterium]